MSDSPELTRRGFLAASGVAVAASTYNANAQVQNALNDKTRASALAPLGTRTAENRAARYSYAPYRSTDARIAKTGAAAARPTHRFRGRRFGQLRLEPNSAELRAMPESEIGSAGFGRPRQSAKRRRPTPACRKAAFTPTIRSTNCAITPM